MRVNSNHNPGDFTKSKGELYFNSNIVQSEKTDEMSGITRTVFDYDQEEISLDKKSQVYKNMLVRFKTDKAVFDVVEKNRIEYDELMGS